MVITILAWAVVLAIAGITAWRFLEYLYAHWRFRRIREDVRQVAREIGMSEEAIRRSEKGLD